MDKQNNSKSEKGNWKLHKKNLDLEEFNLSEQIFDMNMGYDAILVQDVKEFIRLLKEELPDNPDKRNEFIDKIAGDKLLV